MENLSNSEKNISMDRLKQYWLYLGEKQLEDCQLTLFSNGFFQVIDSRWKTVDIYDKLSNKFINRFPIAELPYLTFHVFGNGYMATTDGHGGLDVYAPDGRFFARLTREVKWWGALSAYVYIDNGKYYLADITDAQKKVLLGDVPSILFVEQNINGLVSVQRYASFKQAANYADLYDTNMELITPAHGADKILFFANGSFIIGKDKNYCLYNAQMQLLLAASFKMSISDEYFCLMREKLYDAATGAVIPADNKPIYTANGKLYLVNDKLLSEDGKQILGYCPVRPQVFDGHWLYLRYHGRDLIFDSEMSLIEARQVILQTMLEHNEKGDISQKLFEYLCLIDICVSGRRDIRRTMLKKLVSE